ncbi:MAG: prephenate dehydrogenase/arogenate dehydrogenase family protein [Conexivisphaerales archaeon]
MKVAILGCSGGMGRFFSRYFLRRGFEVFGHDPKKVYLKGIRICRFNSEAAASADLTVIATPLGTEVRVAEEIRKDVKAKSYVMELSSVKGKTPFRIRRLLEGRATLLSIHPLFGPRVKYLRDRTIIAVGGRREAGIVAKLFPEARILTASEEEHDSMMGLMLSLPYILNIAYLSLLVKNPERVQMLRYLTPSASKQIKLAHAITSQQPSLVSGILALNSYTNKYVDELQDEIANISRALATSQTGTLVNLLKTLRSDCLMPPQPSADS